ncbi:MAG: FKBP-type peptidyl-prolyl cis-trans isomerase [Pseudomonadota bacterium]
MIRSIKALVFVAVLGFLVAGVNALAEDAPAKALSEQQKISYALGYNIGNNLKRDFAVDQESFFQGVRDSQVGKATLLTDQEMQDTMMAFQQQMRQKQNESLKEAAVKNKVTGTAFLDENKKKEGVVTLPSGLQYKVIKEGEGASPKASDTVSCHYRGTTIDGVEFDSSYKRGEPASFQVNGVIKGWTEALQLMKTGAKWMLFIPADLAYGDRGAGGVIAPGSTLVFEVELLGIEG